MSPQHFQDDLAQWDLCTGKGLVNDLDAWRDRYIIEKVAQGVSDKTRKSQQRELLLDSLVTTGKMVSPKFETKMLMLKIPRKQK